MISLTLMVLVIMTLLLCLLALYVLHLKAIISWQDSQIRRNGIKPKPKPHYRLKREKKHSDYLG